MPCLSVIFPPVQYATKSPNWHFLSRPRRHRASARIAIAHYRRSNDGNRRPDISPVTIHTSHSPVLLAGNYLVLVNFTFLLLLDTATMYLRISGIIFTICSCIFTVTSLTLPPGAGSIIQPPAQNLTGGPLIHTPVYRRQVGGFSLLRKYFRSSNPQHPHHFYKTMIKRTNIPNKLIPPPNPSDSSKPKERRRKNPSPTEPKPSQSAPASSST